MSGYAVRGRIERVDVRLSADHPMAPPQPANPAAADSGQPSVAIEGTRRGRLEVLLHDLRDRWAQTTFYLFDADSWR